MVQIYRIQNFDTTSMEPRIPTFALERRDFQTSVINAISTGNLAAFRNLKIGTVDVDRRLLPFTQLQAAPKYNPDSKIPVPRGPTMLIFAILCERDEFVSFILDALKPDLSRYIGGFNAIHYAAMTQDFRCLRVLLNHEFYQQNIDIPVLVGGTNTDSCFTTALHCAVSSRRLAQVLLLCEGVKHDEDEPSGANPNQLSESGNPPLYMAVSLMNVDIVRVLMAAGADPSQPNTEGKSPLDLIGEKKEMKDKMGRRSRSDNNIDRIYAILEERDANDFLENLKTELCPEVLPEQVPILDTVDEYESPTPSAIPAMERQLFLDRLQTLERRMERLDTGRHPSPAVSFVASSMVHSCVMCGSPNSTQCRECHRYFCERCMPKLQHECR